MESMADGHGLSCGETEPVGWGWKWIELSTHGDSRIF